MASSTATEWSSELVGRVLGIHRSATFEYPFEVPLDDEATVGTLVVIEALYEDYGCDDTGLGFGAMGMGSQ